jgi:NTE family protein
VRNYLSRLHLARNETRIPRIECNVGIFCSDAAHSDESSNRGRKRALVLSAGGMFGAYQAGVWDALHPVFTPDIVIGASVGSINGYLIACGCPPAELLARWRSLENASTVRWCFSRHVRHGILDSAALEALIKDICKLTPRSEYGLVATETRTCRPRLFRWPDVTWRHIAASCGVPVFLPTYQIDGVYYSDGGLIDPLPLWAALELGATEIVAVDLLKRRPFPIRALVSALRVYSGYRRPGADGVKLLEISPSEPLGDARDSMYWSSANVERWIDLGRRDALAVVDGAPARAA